MLNVEHGGAEAFDRMVQALRAQGLGLVVDVVPNHIAVPVPETATRSCGRCCSDGADSRVRPVVRRRLGRPTSRS